VTVTARNEQWGIISGTLSCPACREDFPIVDGIPNFLFSRQDPVVQREREFRDRIAVAQGPLGSPSLGPTNNYITVLKRTALHRAMGDLRGQAVLDVGVGTGSYLFKYLDARPENTFLLCDLSLEALTRLRARLLLLAPNCNRQVHYVLAEASGLPFRDQGVNLCLCIEVIQHIPEAEARERCMGEALRVLKPGGSYLLMVRQYQPLKRFVRLLMRRKYARENTANPASSNVPYLKRFTTQELRQIRSSFVLRAKRCIGNLLSLGFDRFLIGDIHSSPFRHLAFRVDRLLAASLLSSALGDLVLLELVKPEAAAGTAPVG
jgi:ubiquinone/menaquinone biosynthesis C-methylase UbiE/uncharacterized protein YbaR (Trm112 family)